MYSFKKQQKRRSSHVIVVTIAMFVTFCRAPLRPFMPKTDPKKEALDKLKNKPPPSMVRNVSLRSTQI